MGSTLDYDSTHASSGIAPESRWPLSLLRNRRSTMTVKSYVLGPRG